MRGGVALGWTAIGKRIQRQLDCRFGYSTACERACEYVFTEKPPDFELCRSYTFLWRSYNGTHVAEAYRRRSCARVVSSRALRVSFRRRDKRPHALCVGLTFREHLHRAQHWRSGLRSAVVAQNQHANNRSRLSNQQNSDVEFVVEVQRADACEFISRPQSACAWSRSECGRVHHGHSRRRSRSDGSILARQLLPAGFVFKYTSGKPNNALLSIHAATVHSLVNPFEFQNARKIEQICDNIRL